MIKNRNDKSIKQKVADALLILMTEKSYVEITVIDVVHKAEIARSSFYRNFSSISDVIDMITKEISDVFVEYIFPIFVGNDENKMREFLHKFFYKFINTHKDVAKIQPQNISTIFSRMEKGMRSKEANMSFETLRDKYVVAGKLGMISSITKKWMSDNMKESPEEMINYIMSFIMLF